MIIKQFGQFGWIKKNMGSKVTLKVNVCDADLEMISAAFEVREKS